MNYRFVKKQVPKLASGSESLFSSETNGSLAQQDSEATDRQMDSQTGSTSSSATVLYNSHEGQSQESQTTIPYNPSQDLGSQESFPQDNEGELLQDRTNRKYSKCTDQWHKGFFLLLYISVKVLALMQGKLWEI